MNTFEELKEISATIKQMQTLAHELAARGEDFPALKRNAVRISASLAMLELNVCDIVNG
jgi:hypothetical protein